LIALKIEAKHFFSRFLVLLIDLAFHEGQPAALGYRYPKILCPAVVGLTLLWGGIVYL
jgi:hypothetical protein